MTAAARVAELLLASQNPGKLAEMRVLLADLGVCVRGPREVGIEEAPEETGMTFLENARLKARYYSARSGLTALADDSGLAVEALDGAPGLYTARFGGEGASDAARNRLLLDRLRGVPWERRGARFWCALVLARGDDVLFEVLESVEGRIAEEPRGTQGFGYDPVFFYPPLGCSFAEIERARKDRVSHRGKAFARLREFLAAGPPAGEP